MANEYTHKPETKPVQGSATGKAHEKTGVPESKPIPSATPTPADADKDHTRLAAEAAKEHARLDAEVTRLTDEKKKLEEEVTRAHADSLQTKEEKLARIQTDLDRTLKDRDRAARAVQASSPPPPPDPNAEARLLRAGWVHDQGGTWTCTRGFSYKNEGGQTVSVTAGISATLEHAQEIESHRPLD